MFGGKGSIRLVTESSAIARVVTGSVMSSGESRGRGAAKTKLMSLPMNPKIAMVKRTETHKMVRRGRLTDCEMRRAFTYSRSKVVPLERVKARRAAITSFSRTEWDSVGCSVITGSNCKKIFRVRAGAYERSIIPEGFGSTAAV